jgi:hypothetical protein
MTRPASRIAMRAGQGRGAAPARSAATAWPAVALHLRDDRPRGEIGLRQPLEMTCQVLLHLALGFHHEAEAGLVAQAAGDEADAERTQVPERIEHALARAELAQPLGRPGQMVGFLCGGLGELTPQRGVGRGQRLRAVERLGADLADVIDPHQRTGFAALGVL